jgi:hypothetical protein
MLLYVLPCNSCLSLFFMCLTLHVYPSSCATWGLCSPKVNPKERTCLPPNLASNLEHIIWEYVIVCVAKFALHVQYYINKYWFLSLKNMIIINLSFWTCHKKLIQFLNMFTIWIISFETCSISLSLILGLWMQKIFFECNNNHIGFSFFHLYIHGLLSFSIFSSLSIFSLNYLFCFINFLSLLWVFLCVQNFSLVQVRKLVCELCKGKKKPCILISSWFLISSSDLVKLVSSLGVLYK